MNFTLGIWPISNFWTYHNTRQHTFHKITQLDSHFQLKLKWEDKKLLTFSKQLIKKSQHIYQRIKLTL